MGSFLEALKQRCKWFGLCQKDKVGDNKGQCLHNMPTVVMSKSTEIGHWSYVCRKCYNLYTLENSKELECPGER